MYELTLSLDQLPKSLNVKFTSNRWGRSKENKHFDQIIAMLSFKNMPKSPLEFAHISITRHFWRTLDYDGLVGSMKPVVDALVTCGVLKDDSWKVTGPWQVNQVFRPKKLGPLLEIRITEPEPSHVQSKHEGARVYKVKRVRGEAITS